MVLILGETLPTLAGEVAHAPAFAALASAPKQLLRGCSRGAEPPSIIR